MVLIPLLTGPGGTGLASLGCCRYPISIGTLPTRAAPGTPTQERSTFIQELCSCPALYQVQASVDPSYPMTAETAAQASSRPSGSRQDAERMIPKEGMVPGVCALSEGGGQSQDQEENGGRR